MHTDINDTLYPQIEQYLTDAETYATNSANSAEEAKTYAEEAKQYRDEAQQIAGFDVVDVYSRVDLNKQTIGYQKKNLLKNNLEDKTSNGISCVVNSDKSVTLNGTNNGTSMSLFKLGKTSEVLPAGTYYFNINDGSLDESLFDVSVSYSYVSNPDVFYIDDSFSNQKTLVSITLTEPGFIQDAIIYVHKNVSLNNVTVYPRVYPANIVDYGYEPYVENVNTRLNNLMDEDLELLNNINRLRTALTGAGIDANILQSNNIGGQLSFASLIAKRVVTFFTNWSDTTNFPAKYGSGVLIPALDATNKMIYYQVKNEAWFGFAILESDTVTLKSITWNNISKNGTTVWQNANVSNAVGETTVTVSPSFTPKNYEILFYDSSSNKAINTTGILPIGTKCILNGVGLSSSEELIIYERVVEVDTGSVVFYNSKIFNTSNQTVGQSNYWAIPYKVIFYP